MSTLDTLETLRTSALAKAGQAASLAELDQVRVEFTGKKGSLTQILHGMKELSPEERPLVGKRANEIRNELEELFETNKIKLTQEQTLERISADAIDVTLPGRSKPIGSQHLIDSIIEEITQIFVSIGYRVYDGTQVETDYYNFTALNTPKDHPARSMQDTFYVVDRSGATTGVKGESDVVLRTQTSGVQVHTMETYDPPIYMIAPGKVYRRDVADPSHLPQFTQIEGLVVDEGITFADFKGTMDYFIHELFGADVTSRFRPHFFPFTEPSCEIDMSCPFCKGQGCRFCKGEGWIEILGAGMVDPNVFDFVNIDSEKYAGFAFGMGVERVAALRYDLPDLRMLMAGDMRFLRQF